MTAALRQKDDGGSHFRESCTLFALRAVTLPLIAGKLNGGDLRRADQRFEDYKAINSIELKAGLSQRNRDYHANQRTFYNRNQS